MTSTKVEVPNKINADIDIMSSTSNGMNTGFSTPPSSSLDTCDSGFTDLYSNNFTLIKSTNSSICSKKTQTKVGELDDEEIRIWINQLTVSSIHSKWATKWILMVTINRILTLKSAIIAATKSIRRSSVNANRTKMLEQPHAEWTIMRKTATTMKVEWTNSMMTAMRPIFLICLMCSNWTLIFCRKCRGLSIG